MWILILTIILTPTDGVSIHSVPDFTSQSQCQAAAASWMDAASGVHRSAICVRK